MEDLDHLVETLASFTCHKSGFLVCENDNIFYILQKSGEDVIASRPVPDIMQDGRVRQDLGEQEEQSDQEEWKEEEEEEEEWEKEANELYQWSQELSFDDIR